MTLTVGAEVDFDDVIERLVELAYTRVDMVGKRGEFAVRGGILDVFAPTAEHPVRVEFWGDEVTEMRMFSVADQRSIPEIERRRRDRGRLPRAVADRRRAGAGRRAGRTGAAGGTQVTGSVGDMLAKLAEGIPVDGMEALLPVLRPGELALLTDRLPDGAPVLVCDPEKVRTRAADLIKTGQEFLEASWSVAALGGDAPIDVEAPRRIGFPRARRGARCRAAAGHPWWTLSQLADRVRRSSWTSRPRRRPAAQQRPATRSSRCCARTWRPAASPPWSPRAPEPRTGSSSSSPNPMSPATMLEPGAVPKPGVVGVLKGPLHDGMVLPGRQPGGHHRNRPDRQPGHRHRGQKAGGQTPQRRRPAGADRRRPGGARPARHRQVRRDDRAHRRRRAPRIPGAGVRVGQARAGGTDKLYVPMDSLDQLSRYVGGQAPALSRLGGSDWTNTKTKARKAVREIAWRAGGAVRQAAGQRPGTPSARTPRGRPRWRTRSVSPRPWIS